MILANLRKILSISQKKLHPKRLAISAIKLYKLLLSPYFGGSCRFTPTCSTYAIEAYEKKGFIVGTALTIWRILRCNPFCNGGYDPVKD
ncbi:MAG: membrane protein insertion efficiency factor YidD [Deferribacteraceae bacterium]|nr:membrane protein insertion efficiency factor YidD [Deferribacteraceae bacterium]